MSVVHTGHAGYGASGIGGSGMVRGGPDMCLATSDLTNMAATTMLAARSRVGRQRGGQEARAMLLCIPTRPVLRRSRTCRYPLPSCRTLGIAVGVVWHRGRLPLKPKHVRGERTHGLD